MTPAIGIAYLFSNNVSVETIADMTQHDVDGSAGLPLGDKGLALTFDARHCFIGTALARGDAGHKTFV